MKINNEKATIKNQINIQNNYAPIHLNNQETPEKTNNPVIDKILLKNRIGNNELKEVLDILVETFPKRNDFTLQKSRFSSIEKKERMGVISGDAYNMERNKIMFAVLDMIDEL